MREPGAEDVLELRDVPSPPLGDAELRIAVAAAGVNRADLLQRQGFYPPPPGAPSILGLECAGRVVEVGANVDSFAPGDRVMALLAGGGYAAEVCVDSGCALPVPDAMSDTEAAALPEVFLTVFLNLFQLGGLQPGGRCLVHGGTSGIGTAAIALAKRVGVSIAVTAGSAEKCARCLELGADLAIPYRDEEFEISVREWTGGQGVDVVLDSIGGPYFDRNVASLGLGGKLVLIGLMGGPKAEVDLGPLLYRRISVLGSTLRSRPLAEKRSLVKAFLDRFGADIASGALRPEVFRVFPLAHAAEAHRLMKSSEHIGKIVLSMEAN